MIVNKMFNLSNEKTLERCVAQMQITELLSNPEEEKLGSGHRAEPLDSSGQAHVLLSSAHTQTFNKDL